MSDSHPPDGPSARTTSRTNVSLVCYEKDTHLANFICNEETLRDVPNEQRILIDSFGEDFSEFVKKLAAEQILSENNNHLKAKNGDLELFFTSTESGIKTLAALLKPLPDCDSSVVFPATRLSDECFIPSQSINITTHHLQQFDPEQQLFHWFEDNVVPQLKTLAAPTERVTKIYLLSDVLNMRPYKNAISNAFREDNPLISSSVPGCELNSGQLFNTLVLSTVAKMLAIHEQDQEAARVAANVALRAAEEAEEGEQNIP